MKLSLTILSILVSLLLSFQTKAELKSSSLMEADSVLVGSKLNDSTAQLSISNAQIQSLIMPHFSSLANSTITNQTPVIIMGKDLICLTFQVVKDTTTHMIAIELKLVNNLLKFKYKAGIQFQSCTAFQGCGCNFIVNQRRDIIGCGCASNVVNQQCNYRMYSIQ